MKAITCSILALILTAGLTTAQSVTIEWWQFWTDPAVKPTIETIVAEFEAAHPDIDVNLTDLTWANGHEKIVIALASGTGPDVFELGSDWIAQFAHSGHLPDITAHSKSDQSDLQGWSMATHNDKVYARPWILGTRILFANRDLLNRAGYAPNFVPTTIDQLVEAAGKVRALGRDVYGWGSNTAEKHRLYKKFLPFFWSCGAQIFSDDGNYCVLSSTYAIEALTKYKQLHDSSGFVADQRGIEDAFLAGKIGFIMTGDWLLKRVKQENRRIDLVSTLMPGKEFVGRSFLGGEFLAINAASKQTDSALLLIEWITSSENQVRFCKANLSANPSSLQAQQDPLFTSDVHLQTFIKQVKMANHPPVHPEWVNMETAIEEAVEDALFGSGLIAEPLRLARDKIAELMK